MFSARGVEPVTYSGTWPKEPQEKETGQRFISLYIARNETVFGAAERVMTITTNLRIGIAPTSMGVVTHRQVSA